MTADSDKPKSSGSFWTSIQGVITAVTGLIVAVGGIITVLATNHLLPGSTSATTTQPAAAVTAPAQTSAAAGGAATAMSGANDAAIVAKISQLFTQDALPSAMFAPSFLAKTNLNRLHARIRKIKQTMGQYNGASRTGDHFSASFAKGNEPVTMALDDEGKITELRWR